MLKSNWLFWTILILASIIMIVSVAFAFMSSFNDHEYTVTVTDKDRVVINTEDGTSSKYLIYTEDSTGQVRVFENTDNLFRFKWNSSDIQASLKIGETYTVEVVGYRVPFLSWYENIIAIR